MDKSTDEEKSLKAWRVALGSSRSWLLPQRKKHRGRTTGAEARASFLAREKRKKRASAKCYTPHRGVSICYIIKKKNNLIIKHIQGSP